jgi:hypothetical protein
VVLFGSRARGGAQSDSDYDIAVFLRDLVDRETEMNRLADIATEILYNGLRTRDGNLSTLKEQNFLVDETANLGQQQAKSRITKHPVSSTSRPVKLAVIESWCFLLIRSPRRGLSILKFPFRVRTLYSVPG